ncbi:MAG: hypothetical protein JRI85_17860 [Deltaproteobacteria bacterium]|nr:hypothetical protein [Deltaproteobacteria bacterium]
MHGLSLRDDSTKKTREENRLTQAEYPPDEVRLSDVRVIGRIIWLAKELVKGEE